MRRSRRMGAPLAAAALAALGAGHLARAASAGFLQVPITAEAIVDDASLANRVTNDFRVTVPTGFDWSNSAIEIVLSAGGVYNAGNAAATESAPNSALWAIPTLRNGQFDSFVTTKNFGSATILGSFQNGADKPPPAEGLTTADATAIRVSWGDTIGGEDGTFTVGRFTLSANATGTFSGRTFASDNAGVGVPFSGTIVNGVLAVPEPSTAAVTLLAGASGLLSRRARRRNSAGASAM